MSNTSKLELQIENDLEQLKQILSTCAQPKYFDNKLAQLGVMLDSDVNTFITVAPSCIKIRSEENERLAKVDVEFVKGIPEGIADRVQSNMRNRDAAYLLLLTMQANGMWDRVKFHYRGSAPRKQELTAITNARCELAKLTVDGPIEVRVGSITCKIDGVIDIPNVPKADFAFTLNGIPQVYLSHKHFNHKTTAVNSFRQYSGLSKFCLGELSNCKEVIALVDELKQGFSEANLGMKELRKGSYFAKRITNTELICAAMFGRDYNTQQSGIHNVDLIVQGDISFKNEGDHFVVQSNHTIINPQHVGGHLHLDEEYDPYFLIMKSSHVNQFFENTRIAIWPCNKVVQKGLENYSRFFLCKEYDAFK